MSNRPAKQLSTSPRRTRRAGRLRIVALAGGLVLLAAACASAGDDTSFTDVGSAVGGGAAPGWSEDGAPADSEWTGGDGSGEELFLAESDAASRSTPGAPSALADSDDSPPVPPPVETEEAVGEITAGSVDDNDLWDEYLLYRQSFAGLGIPVSDIDVSGRQILSVVDADGDPVLGAAITITDGTGATVASLATYADGRAVFHASTDTDPTSQSRPSYTAQVDKAGVTTTQELEPGALTQTITLDGDIATTQQLDVLFLVDATGSMSDEIERLKANMISVSERIQTLDPVPDVRYGMVVYRDQGDTFVTREIDFTADVVGFTEALAEVVADGGGDTPESLNAGLNKAVSGVSWRDGEAVKLVFLVADAPPHLAGEPGYEAAPDYAVDIVNAAALGIKVFPIASSGLDEQGQYVFRQLAQITMGRFVFLTYGADGSSPGTSTPHDVDPADYDVLALDDLVVQLVTDEMVARG